MLDWTNVSYNGMRVDLDRQRKDRRSMPNAPFADFAAFEHCKDGFKSFWIQTPRSFSSSTLSNFSPLIQYCSLGLLLPTCITLHLLTLNCIPHVSAQFAKWSMSAWSFFASSSLATTRATLLSLANSIATTSSVSVSRSFNSEHSPSTTTLCCRPISQSTIHSRSHPSIPMAFSFDINFRWGTLSNACVKGFTLVLPLCYPFKEVKEVCCGWPSVPEPGLIHLQELFVF